MSDIEADDAIHICNFCGATDDDGKTDCLVMGQDGTLICDSCIALCEAILAERKRDDIDFQRIPAKHSSKTKEKLRPVTRIPKRWVVCDTHLHKTIPSLTACSPDGEKCEDFSIPKQLAHWMVSYDQKMDIDKIREEIKKDLTTTVRRALWSY